MKNNKIIKDFCEKHKINAAQFSGKEKISGNLYLGSVTSIPEGFNPTVGGYLITKNSRKYIGSTVKPVERTTDFIWEKYGKRFGLIDRIFCEILTTRKRTVNGEVYHIHSAKKISKKEVFFIANKGKFYAHGKTVKKAISDLQFKVVADKLKNEPIKKDTIITMNYYRLITGSCELGIKSWMAQNGIKKDEIKASELLPLLEKSHAYGLERFKKLLTF